MRASLSRRKFLEGTAATSALLATQTVASSVPNAGDAALPKLPPVKIYKVYAGRTGNDYLTRPTEELGRFEKYFAKLEKSLGDVRFIGGDMVPPAKVNEVAARLKGADGSDPRRTRPPRALARDHRRLLEHYAYDCL